MIGVCGFGYSGSGAVLDLLKEYNDVQVFDDFELFITYFPDGLCDLYEHLCVSHSRFFDGDVAVKRFLDLTKKMGSKRQYKTIFGKDFVNISREYIMSLVSASWKGFWAYDWYHAGFFEKNLFFRLGLRINRLFNRRIIKSSKVMYLSYVDSDYFIEMSKDYIRKLLSAFDIDPGKLLVLNQCFPANDPQKCFAFFDSPKAIIVTRDPRDTYIMAKKVVGDDAAWIPTDNVKNFISFYRSQYNEIVTSPDILLVRFEDLIYRYGETKNQIENFLNIKSPKTPNKYFDPNVSINNTQLFKRFPEYQDDISIIEKELNSFLYDFDEFDTVNYSSKRF